ncbi:MAG: (d)CMP kinase [Bacteriovoracaceae bacterium]|nr:(d)CMP kinase [Bacteriovoracaceae bacterium]
MDHVKVVAIDGPSGSGKSSIAQDVGKLIGATYIDTGAMFRAIGLVSDRLGIRSDQLEKFESFLATVKLEYGVSPDCLIRVDGEDLSDAIREHGVSKLASSVSKLPVVRNYLLQFQRELAKKELCIMEGRDIGTVVFPNAFCKVFMTAKEEVRAARRYNQLKELGNDDIDLEQVLEDIKIRDANDRARDHAPLKQAFDAVLVDTSELSYNEVLQKIQEIVNLKAKEVNIKL